MRKNNGSQRTLVEEIVRGEGGERWYGDGPPRWTQGRSNRPAMTRRQARLQRRKLVKALRRHGEGNNAALRLAERIAACRPGRRCLSGACPECSRAMQRLFVATSDRLITGSDTSLTAVSVVFRGAGIAEGKLAQTGDPFSVVSQKLRAVLRKAGVRQAVGGFDISANEHAEQRFAPHYRPHAWIIVPASQMARGDKVFREYFPASRTVRRPVRVQEFDGDLRGLAYAVKTDFVRRISLPRKPLADGSVTRRNTRDRPLLGRQRVELALALDRIGLGARIFLHGLRMVKTADNVRIVRTEATRRPTRERQEARSGSPKPNNRTDAPALQPCERTTNATQKRTQSQKPQTRNKPMRPSTRPRR